VPTGQRFRNGCFPYRQDRRRSRRPFPRKIRCLIRESDPEIPGCRPSKHAGHCDVIGWRHAGSKPRWSCCLLELHALAAWASMGSSLIPTSQQTNEIGIRMASEHSVPPSLLGLWSGTIPRRRGFARRGGSVLGLRASCQLSFGINPADPATILGVILFPGPRGRVLGRGVARRIRAAMLAETLAWRDGGGESARRGLSPVGFWSWRACWWFWVGPPFFKAAAVSPRWQNKSEPQSYKLVRNPAVAGQRVVSTRNFPATGFTASVPKVMKSPRPAAAFGSSTMDELLALLADKPAS